MERGVLLVMDQLVLRGQEKRMVGKEREWITEKGEGRKKEEYDGSSERVSGRWWMVNEWQI